MTLSWVSIVRLGLVQMCLGAVVVLTTSTLNRLMVVELALPALLPGFLVALHYGIQITRPNWGYRSDTSGNRTRWIIGGMAILSSGAFLAALAIPVLEARFATATAPRRRAAAATITWLMMILGIAVTAGTVGALLDPYSHARLMRIVAVVTLGAVVLTSLAIWRVERGVDAQPEPDRTPFIEGLREVWQEPKARMFTLFVFLAMTAYFMQELILEPYAGLVFGFTPGQSTSLSGAQNGGVFVGMLLVGIAATGLRLGSLRAWVVAGCLGSAACLAVLTLLGPMGPGAPLVPAVVALGFFNGMFAVAAIGSMMALAGEGRGAREGTRMGLWGAAQAMAAGFGGLLGAASVDVLRVVLDSDASAFGAVFLAEGALFLAAAFMAARIMEGRVRGAQLVPGE
jgi:BCD family chlorophyll transporter-like MFS transporter